MIMKDKFFIIKIRIKRVMLLTFLTKESMSFIAISILNNKRSRETYGTFIFFHIPNLALLYGIITRVTLTFINYL